MLKKSDIAIIVLSLLSTLSSLALVLTILPSDISFSFSNDSMKSSYYLVLLALIPLIAVYLVAVTDKSRMVSTAVLCIIDGYALLVVLKAIGIDIDFSVIVLASLALLSLLLSLLLFKGKVKAHPKWIDTEEAENKAGRIAALLFALIALELLVTALLSAAIGLPGGVAVIPVMLTSAVFLVVLARKTI